MKIHKTRRAEDFLATKQNLSRVRVSEQNKRFLRALPAGRVSHFMSRIYPSLMTRTLNFARKMQNLHLMPRARQNHIRLIPRAGKYAPGAKRGKICNRCQARENIHPKPSERKDTPGAGKHAVDARRGERM